MASLLPQRELLATYKQETLLNLKTIHLVHPLSDELSRALFKEDSLEKLTQNVFISLSHYLVSIISPKQASALPWPLYDSKSERAYKNELASLLVQYESTGLVSPILSSYFVNPSSIKVTKLMYQLSLLAVKTILQRDIGKDSVKEQLKDATDKYKSKEFSLEHFNELADSSTKQFSGKILNFESYKKEIESIGALMKLQIKETESEYKNKMDVVNKHIDTFLSKHKFDDDERKLLKAEIQQEGFFESWLTEVDNELDALENSWNTSMAQPLLDSSRNCLEVASSLVARHVGEADKKSYILEYDHEQDNISTAPLEAVSSTTEIHILRNITNDCKLNFPNLIRGFSIAVCHIFKSTTFSDDVFQITQYLGSSHAKVAEVLSGLRTVMKDFVAAQDKLKSLRTAEEHTEDIERNDVLLSIPPLPDLTINFTPQIQVAPDGYTPLNINRRQFHVHRKMSLTDNLLYRQPPRSLMTTPFHSGFQNEFFKSVTTTHATDRRLVQHVPLTSNSSSKVNETVAGDATGFTKQQILRLLSTKKTSIKKAKSQKNREDVKIRGELFNKSNDGAGLFRCHSSPNLYESRERRQLTNKMTLLSPMHEVIHSPLEISGIVALGSNSKDNSPLQLLSVNALPDIVIVSPIEKNIPSKVSFMNFEAINLEMTPEKQVVCDRTSANVECTSKEITPKLMSHPIRKTSSIEKLINRYKRVRETAVVGQKEITEEAAKENVPQIADDMFNISDDVQYKPRQSLGTVLGVDNTFLDQFDLVD